MAFCWYGVSPKNGLVCVFHAILWGLVPACGVAQQQAAEAPQEIVAAIENATQVAIQRAGRSVVAIARAPKQRVQRAQLDIAMQLGAGWNQSSLLDADYVPVFFGTGVVVSSDGYIVTCAHVLGDPRENDYVVWLDRHVHTASVVRKVGPAEDVLAGEDLDAPVRQHAATVLASDAFSDLAILKVDVTDLTPIVMGDVSQLKRGSFVVALGNPDAVAHDGIASASWGIVSNLHRRAPVPDGDATAKPSIHGYGTLIQADVRTGPGTSGGALVDFDGRLVGLMTNLTARQGQGRPAGFAIAADELFLKVVERLKAGRLPEFGFLGIQPDNLRLQERAQGHQGAIVRAVLRGLPGELAGLQADDVIVQVNANRVFSRDDLFRELSQAGADSDVVLLVDRLGHPGITRPVSAHLSKKPASADDISYASNAPNPWRGIKVDYATALPPELLIAGVFSRDASMRPKLAAIEVQPGSLAWQAGIRAGEGLERLDGRAMQTPDEFYAAAAAITGKLTIEVVGLDGRTRQVELQSEPAENDASGDVGRF